MILSNNESIKNEFPVLTIERKSLELSTVKGLHESITSVVNDTTAHPAPKEQLAP